MAFGDKGGVGCCPDLFEVTGEGFLECCLSLFFPNFELFASFSRFSRFGGAQGPDIRELGRDPSGMVRNEPLRGPFCFLCISCDESDAGL